MHTHQQMWKWVLLMIWKLMEWMQLLWTCLRRATHGSTYHNVGWVEMFCFQKSVVSVRYASNRLKRTTINWNNTHTRTWTKSLETYRSTSDILTSQKLRAMGTDPMVVLSSNKMKRRICINSTTTYIVWNISYCRHIDNIECVCVWSCHRNHSVQWTLKKCTQHSSIGWTEWCDGTPTVAYAMA